MGGVGIWPRPLKLFKVLEVSNHLVLEQAGFLQWSPNAVHDIPEVTDHEKQILSQTRVWHLFVLCVLCMLH